MTITTSDIETTSLALPDVASAAVTALVERVRPGVVQVQNGGRGGGSGVVWRSDGVIVTNHHVVANARHIRVALYDGRTFDATVMSSNPALDLAVLNVQAGDLPAVLVDDSTKLRVGELVFAIGHPWGQRWFVTSGIVSGIGAASMPNSERKAAYIRSDVGLAPGNSGGPLLNARGAVVGINAMIFGGDLAVSIPSQVAIDWIAGLPSRRVTLGLQVQTVELPVTMRQGPLANRTAGLMVVGVTPRGPANRAAVFVGDVVLDVGDTPVSDPHALLEALARRDAREVVRLNVLRSGAIQPIDVHVAQVEQEG